MATNRDLLKEAIADAKAVKETAIANAKAALTESFTPFLREKLSAKIQEMDEEDMDKMTYEEVEENEGLDEISLDELLAELEENDSKEMEDENLYEAKKDEEKEEKDEEMSIEDMDEDELKSFIEDVIKDMVSAGELEAGHEEGEAEEEEEMEVPEEGEEMEASEEEELDLEELLAEIEEGESEETDLMKKENLSEEPITLTALGITAAALAAAALSGMSLEQYAEKQKEKDPNSKWAKFLEFIRSTKTNKEESLKVKRNTEMEENAQIAELKSELNEINLLNSKLLYTNKIFRSKSLSESQKIKVLTAFDKAKTKKEAQLVYETLLESLKVSTIGAKTAIKESLGSASKSLGSANAKPIIENNAFARMRELAGLKK